MTSQVHAATTPVEDLCQDCMVRLPNGELDKCPAHGGKVTPIRATLARMSKFTVTFYSHSTEPKSLPDFPYAVAGTVLAHTKFLAYVKAESASEAQEKVVEFFDVAQVSSIEAGWNQMEEAPLRGTILPDQPAGLFYRIFRYLFG